MIMLISSLSCDHIIYILYIYIDVQTHTQSIYTRYTYVYKHNEDVCITRHTETVYCEYI